MSLYRALFNELISLALKDDRPMKKSIPTRTPDEKLQHVEDQLALCEAGQLEEMDCPYCGVVNKRGESLCCNLFASAAMNSVVGVG